MKSKTFIATVREHLSPFGSLGRITSHHLTNFKGKKVKVRIEVVEE